MNEGSTDESGALVVCLVAILAMEFTVLDIILKIDRIGMFCVRC